MLQLPNIAEARERKAAADATLEDAVTVVAATRPNLVDAWEAAAVAESLGYTSDRVRRELGFADARAFGEFLFERLAVLPIAPPTLAPSPAPAPGAPAAARAWGFSCVAYALLWIAAHLLEQSAWAPAQTAMLSLMAGLIVTAGMAFAIQQRGHFYRALDQPALAQVTGAYIWRVGAILTLAVAAASMAIAWLSGVAPWRQLVLWTDGFVLASLTVLTIARGTVGGVWPAGRETPCHAEAFGEGGTPAAFPLPRMTVVLAGAMPRAATVCAGFALLFSERLWMSAAGGDWAGNLAALDAAALATLLGMANIERVAGAFSCDMAGATSEPAGSGAGAIARAARRSHVTALLWNGAAYCGIGVAVAAAVVMGRFDARPDALVFALAGGLPLILALVNGRLLHTLRKPGVAVASLAAGSMVAVIVATATAGLAAPAGLALSAGAMVSFAVSTVAVRRALRHCDHALLVA
jgi:hypothetical protein